MHDQNDRLITAITEPPPVPPHMHTLRMHHPAPGIEYPFSISDITHAAAALLGSEWSADAGHWGICGYLWGPYTASFTLLVDIEGDLCLVYDCSATDEWPESPHLPHGVLPFSAGLYLPDVCVTDGLDHIAQQLAAAVRAITGR